MVDLFRALYKLKNGLETVRDNVENLLLSLSFNMERRITYLDLLIINLIESNKVPNQWLLTTSSTNSSSSSIIETTITFSDWISNIITSFNDIKIIEAFEIDELAFKNHIMHNNYYTYELIIRMLIDYSINEKVNT